MFGIWRHRNRGLCNVGRCRLKITNRVGITLSFKIFCTLFTYSGL